MACAGVHGLQPLLDWLLELNIITKHDRGQYIRGPPQLFFDELRDGCILSKLAVTAVPQSSSNYRSELYMTAITRYVGIALAKTVKLV